MIPIPRRRAVLRAVLATPGLGLAHRSAAAQDGGAYPNRPLRLVVPYAPGGLTDLLGRSVAQAMAQFLGQPVAVENRPGANTVIGAQAVAQAAPDGLTLLMTSGASYVVNPLIYRRLPFDAERDLRVLGVLVETPFVVLVNARSPARDLSGLVALARGRPGGLNFAAVGQGNPLHLSGEMLRLAAGIDLTVVVYPGSAPALLALEAGEVDVMFDVLGGSLALVRDGRLRALAVTGRDRAALLPDVPTTAGAGFPAVLGTTWFGVAAPRAVPERAAARLRDALAAVAADPGFRARFAEFGLAVRPPGDEAAITAFLAEERERWGAVIRERGLSLDMAR